MTADSEAPKLRQPDFHCRLPGGALKTLQSHSQRKGVQENLKIIMALIKLHYR